jgi:hypothetical protein
MIAEEVEKAVKLIKKGIQRDAVLKRIRGYPPLTKDDIFEIAKTKIKAREKFGELAERLFFDEEGLRYATPEVVARYRAERLKCGIIADVSCGAGAQLVFFGLHCEKAYGVEIDRKRAFLAMLNAKQLGLDNVEIIVGDALDDATIRKISDAEIIFSDPARPPNEKVRTMENLFPNPLKVYEKYIKVTPEMAFELPPQMPPERVKQSLSGEKEYVSLNFKLNRLALYTGELAEHDVSAVSLPSGEKVTSEDERVKLEKGEPELKDLKSFIYEVDYTVVKASLLENLAGKLGFNGIIVEQDNRRVLLSSDQEYSSHFLRRYDVLDVVPFTTFQINRKLKELGAKKVTLRFSLSPKEYWEVRKKMEEGLEGERWLYLFRIGDKGVIAEPCEKV